jgi:hypothetical protein
MGGGKSVFIVNIVKIYGVGITDFVRICGGD